MGHTDLLGDAVPVSSAFKTGLGNTSGRIWSSKPPSGLRFRSRGAFGFGSFLLCTGNLLVDTVCRRTGCYATGAGLIFVTSELAAMTGDANKYPSVAPLGPPETFPGATVGVGDGKRREEAGWPLWLHDYRFITAFVHSSVDGARLVAMESGVTMWDVSARESSLSRAWPLLLHRHMEREPAAYIVHTEKALTSSLPDAPAKSKATGARAVRRAEAGGGVYRAVRRSRSPHLF